MKIEEMREHAGMQPEFPREGNIELLKKIAGNLPAIFFSVDEKGIFTESVGAGLARLGLDDGEVLGTNALENFPQASDKIREALGGKSVCFETSGETGGMPGSKVGETLGGEPWNFLTYLYYDAERGGGATGFAIDITDRVQAKIVREALIQELEKKNAELEQLTRMVSHDLKSPLIAIVGFLRLLERHRAEDDEEKMRADREHIFEAAKWMEQLIHETLQFSAAGHQCTSRQEVPIKRVAQKIVEMGSSILEKRGIRVSISPELPTIYGDARSLREVLENLVNNAIKYMGDQPNPIIEIGVTKRGDQTIIFVADNGTGIGEEHHEKIFKMFNRVDTRTKGTGLGLAIVERIVKSHGGRVWVESEGKGKGSAFMFTLGEEEKPPRAPTQYTLF